MVLSRISEERRTTRHRYKHSTNRGKKITLTKQTSYNPAARENSTRSASLTTAIANESLSSTSSSTDDTLSMISTPWSTESWESQSTLITRSMTWTNSPIGSFTSLTIEPKTTTTYGNASPDIMTGSNLTLTLLGDVLSTPSGSRYVQPLTRQTSGSSPTYASWTIETYTSTGLVSSLDCDGLKVNYPWSPSTFMSGTEITDYPSSLTLISRKGSREGFRKENIPLTPMNYVVLAKDEHPMLDWILVKQKGILTYQKGVKVQKN